MPEMCVVHPSTPARETCAACQRLYCDDCWVSARGMVICRGCAARRQRRGSLTLGGLALAGVGALSYALFFLPGASGAVPEPTSVKLSAERDYGFAGAPTGISALALSSTGDLLASAGKDGTIKLWNPETGASLGTLAGPREAQNALCFSNGRLVSGGEDKRLHIWDVSEKKEIASLERHVGAITDLAPVPYTTRVVSVGADGQIVLWDTARLALERPVTSVERGLLAVAVSPEGERIAVGGKPGSDGRALVQLFETATGNLITELPIEEPAVTALAFSPDGTRLAISGISQGVHEFNLSTMEDLLVAPSVFATRLAYEPGGLLLASTRQGELLAYTTGPVSQVASLKLSEDPIHDFILGSRKVFAAGAGPDIWSLSSVPSATVPSPKAQLLVARAHSGRATDLRFLPDGQLLVTGLTGAYRYRVVGNASEATLRYSSGPTFAVSSSRDGSYLAFATNCLSSCQVDLTMGLTKEAVDSAIARLEESGIKAEKQEEKGGGFTLRVQAQDRDSAYLALGEVDLIPPPQKSGRGAAVFSQDGQRGLMLETGGSFIVDVDFSPRDLTIAAATSQGEVLLFDAGSSRPLHRLKEERVKLSAVAFSPDGSLLAVAQDTGGVVLWDVASQTRVRTLFPFEGAPSEVLSLHFTPDGNSIMIGNYAGEMSRLDVKTGDRLATYRGFHEPVVAVTTSRDGRFAAGGTGNGKVRIYDLASGELATTLQSGEELSALTFGEDGRLYIAGYSPESSVSVWSLKEIP